MLLFLLLLLANEGKQIKSLACGKTVTCAHQGSETLSVMSALQAVTGASQFLHGKCTQLLPQ